MSWEGRWVRRRPPMMATRDRASLHWQCEEKAPRALPMLHFSQSGWWKTFTALHIMRLITLRHRGERRKNISRGLNVRMPGMVPRSGDVLLTHYKVFFSPFLLSPGHSGTACLVASILRAWCHADSQCSVTQRVDSSEHHSQMVIFCWADSMTARF